MDHLEKEHIVQETQCLRRDHKEVSTSTNQKLYYY